MKIFDKEGFIFGSPSSCNKLGSIDVLEWGPNKINILDKPGDITAYDNY
jgi:hypothetical protein